MLLNPYLKPSRSIAIVAHTVGVHVDGLHDAVFIYTLRDHTRLQSVINILLDTAHITVLLGRRWPLALKYIYI